MLALYRKFIASEVILRICSTLTLVEAITVWAWENRVFKKLPISAMNLLFPTPRKCEDLISIYLPGMHDFYQ